MDCTASRPSTVHWRDLVLYAGVWTLLAVFATTQSVVSQAYNGEHIDWIKTIGSAGLNWYTCGIGTPLYVWLVRRYPLRGERVRLRVGLYIAVMVTCVVAKYTLWVPLQNTFFHAGWTLARELIPNVFGVFVDQVYFVVLLYAIEYYRTTKATELQQHGFRRNSRNPRCAHCNRNCTHTFSSTRSTAYRR